MCKLVNVIITFLFFVNSYVAAPRPVLGYLQENSVFQLLLPTPFSLIFDR